MRNVNCLAESAIILLINSQDNVHCKENEERAQQDSLYWEES